MTDPVDDETLRNVNEDGRVTLQFEVLPTTVPAPPVAPIPACQLVKIQGTGSYQLINLVIRTLH